MSSAEQNLDRQLEAVGECDRIFQDKISGSSRAKRTGLAELMQYVREGDLVKVASMDRLGRDTRDLYAIVDELTAKGCAVQFVSERITVNKSGTSPVDGLMLGILAAFAEFERRRIKERQAEGIALAKARGKYVQAPKLSDTDVEQARVMIEMGIPKAEVARTFGVSRQTGLLKVRLTLRVWWFRPLSSASRWSQTRPVSSFQGRAAGVGGGRSVRSR